MSDDGSTDETREVVESFKEKIDVVLVNNFHSGGPAGPRNKGALVARGEFLVFIDSDDIALPNKLSEIFSLNSQAWDILYHPLRLVTHRSQSNSRNRLVGAHRIVGDPYRHLLDFGNPIALSGAIIRADFFATLGGFDEAENLTALEDFDFWLRAAIAGARFQHLPQVLGEYHSSRNQLSKSRDAKRNLAFLIHRYADDMDLDDFERSVWAHYGMARLNVLESKFLASVKIVVGFGKVTRSRKLAFRLALAALSRKSG